MLAKADPQQREFSETRDAGQVNAPGLRLRELLIESLPYFYLTAGFASFYATLYISDWFWILPHYLVLLAAGLHIAYSLISDRGKNAGNHSDND